MKTIYFWHEITKKYTLSQEVEDSSDIPNSTTIEPPEAEKGYATIWNSNKNNWEIVKDYSGTEYWIEGDTYNTPPHIWWEIIPVPKEYSTSRPDPTFEEKKEEETKKIKDRRQDECFEVIDRSQLWYKHNVNTPEREKELDDWYQAWLHVTDVYPYVEPVKPSWIE